MRRPAQFCSFSGGSPHLSAIRRQTLAIAVRTPRGVMLSGGGLDESPMAYRRLPEVLAHHRGSVKVIHTLRPFAVAMAGEAEFDPWKD